MRRQLLDVDDGQAGDREDPLRGQQGQVRVVLVVDRVVLAALDEPQQMWNLDADPALAGNQGAQPAGEVHDVGDVRDDIVGYHEVGRTVLAGDLASGLLAEEEDLGGNTSGKRGFGDVTGRLDAERADSPTDDMLKQVTV